MIKPTVGRIVWYYPSHTDRVIYEVNGNDPFAAIVVGVISDTHINIVLWDFRGMFNSKQNVQLIQGGEKVEYGHCEWMPYQKGQAAKAEALEAKLGI